MYLLTAAALDGILLFVKVKNLLHGCVKQWLRVDWVRSSFAKTKVLANCLAKIWV